MASMIAGFVAYLFLFSLSICPFDSIVSSGVKLDNVAFRHF